MSIFIARIRGYRSSTWLLVGAAYAAVSAVLVYGVLNTDLLNDGSLADSFWEGGSLLFVLVPAHFLVGLLVARWWTAVLPLLLVAVSVPAGSEFDGYPELPIWFYIAIELPVFFVPSLLAGVAVRKLLAVVLGPANRSEPRGP